MCTLGAVQPRGLYKGAAIAHVLAGEPHGLPFRDVARSASARNLANAQLSTERLDGGFEGNPWVHLYGKGCYRHNRFLSFDLEDVPTIANAVRLHLEGVDGGSQNLQSMHGNFESQHNLDYYDLRYALSEFGAGHGLFFTGKSGVDTVSLNGGERGILRHQAVLTILTEADEAMTAPEIANRMQNKSLGLVLLNLARLKSEGKVVRVDRQMYTTTEQAFKDSDIESIGAHLDRIIHEAGRPVERDVLRTVLNEELRLGHSRYFYEALARHFASRYGWISKGVFFHTDSIPFGNRRELAKRCFAPGCSKEEGLFRLRDTVRVTYFFAERLWGWHNSQPGSSLDDRPKSSLAG